MASVTDWRGLQDAYGSAELVGGLLERADTDERAVWDELWSRLCHQGTFYTASYAALPRLAELATRRDPAGFVEPLFLATSIITSTDGPEAVADVRARYTETINVLHEVAERLVSLAGDDTDFVYRVQALLATEGTSPWASRLDSLADQELELACSNCGEQLLISLESSPSLVRQFDDAAVGTTSMVPADPSALTVSEARAYELAVTHGRPQVAEQMLEMFGVFECPNCRSRERAASALE
ncbi:MAG: hypothetical protein R2731_02265 [Nocardioides sp.]